MLFFCMSVSGAIPTILCMILFMLKKQEFYFETGRRLILLSVLFYLFPFQPIKYLLPTDWSNYIDISFHMNYFDGFEKSIVFSVGKNDYWIPNMVAILGFVWMIVIILFTVVQIFLYERRIFVLKKQSREIFVYIKEMGEQKLCIVDGLSSPYTVGFVKPFIVIPENLLAEKSIGMVYRHEYYHLRKHDSLVKLLCLITFCVHWYNPLALLNLFLYEWFAEFLADQYAVKGCTDTEKKDYIRLMLRVASGKDKMPIVWKNNLYTTKKMIEWRMFVIMKNKRKKKIVSSILAVVISVICSCTTIMAYTPLQISSGTKNVINSKEGYMEFNKKSVDAKDFSTIGERIFISEDGTVYPIEDNEGGERVLCIHDFEWGELSSHVPNDSGGCTMYVYEAKKCKKCNYLVVYDLLYRIIYEKCPH